MPEDMEVPTDHLHESMHHEVEHGAERWTLLVALSAALLAVFAAIGSLLASHHANEAVIEQIQAADQWAYFQAKGVKSAVLEGKMELLQALGKELSAKDEQKVAEYRKEQKEIEDRARENEQSSTVHLAIHDLLARAVTFIQVAIAMAAVSVLSRKRWLWVISLLLGLTGIVYFVQALI